jgi:hypothetical protein
VVGTVETSKASEGCFNSGVLCADLSVYDDVRVLKESDIIASCESVECTNLSTLSCDLVLLDH